MDSMQWLAHSEELTLRTKREGSKAGRKEARKKTRRKNKRTEQ
jgi:hypothetical protein